MGILLRMTWAEEDKPLPKTLALTFLSLSPKFLGQAWWRRGRFLSLAPAHSALLTRQRDPSRIPHSETLIQEPLHQTKFPANKEDFSPYCYTFLLLIFIDKDVKGLFPNLTAKKWRKQDSDSRCREGTSVRAHDALTSSQKMFSCSFLLKSEECHHKI